MSKKKSKKTPKTDGSSLFEPESIMKFQEMPLDVAVKMFKESGIYVSDEETSEILSLFHTLTKITIKEFLLNKD